MQDDIKSDAALETGRLFSASAQEVFAAFQKADKLARWWGPDGFTNTFERFEFKPGGRWNFEMHGPNGVDYHNENVFHEIEQDRRIVIEHLLEPWFLLSVSLEPRADGQTYLSWVQQFKNANIAEKMRPLAETANQQVLNRLGVVLAEKL